MMAAHDAISLVFVVGGDDNYSACITVDFLCAFEFVLGEILLIWGEEVLYSYIL
jgi:hypothetical protein